MSKALRYMAAAALTSLLGGCAIQQTVSPVLQLTTKEVCIVEDPSVRSGFLQTYSTALRDKGYGVRVLPANSDVRSCPITSTYMARWSWDFTIYLSEAEISVYREGSLAGSAVYNSKKHGGFRLDKWVDADAKVTELANQLFP